VCSAVPVTLACLLVPAVVACCCVRGGIEEVPTKNASGRSYSITGIVEQVCACVGVLVHVLTVLHYDLARRVALSCLGQ
jgi:hypothetical protein